MESVTVSTVSTFSVIPQLFFQKRSNGEQGRGGSRLSDLRCSLERSRSRLQDVQVIISLDLQQLFESFSRNNVDVGALLLLLKFGFVSPKRS